MAYKHKKITLRKLPYNTDYQIIGDIVVKLKYEPLEETKPKIEIFKITPVTQEDEYVVYGSMDLQLMKKEISL